MVSSRDDKIHWGVSDWFGEWSFVQRLLVVVPTSPTSVTNMPKTVVSFQRDKKKMILKGFVSEGRGSRGSTR